MALRQPPGAGVRCSPPAPDCSATGGDWSCYLPGIFRFLLVIAILLGLILAAVIFLAVKSYRKNKDDQKVGS